LRAANNLDHVEWPETHIANVKNLMKSQTPTNVIVVIGAGSIGQAIARRVSAGKQVLLADLRQENAEAAAKTLSEAGLNVTTATVDVSSRFGSRAR
jgi:NAD(P)-dependent dehydrogenase (short-subunit alcohol dehydrogenase family)